MANESGVPIDRTMARSFSAELMDIFRIENSISDLDSQVDQRSARPLPPLSPHSKNQHIPFTANLVIRSIQLTRPSSNRKQKVGQSNDELASLEARIKEMEERLRKTKNQSRPSIASVTDGAADTTNEQKQEDGSSSSTYVKAEGGDDASSKARSRPGTARATQQAPSSGNMPPTPGASEGD